MNYAINDTSPYRPHPSKAKVIEDSARTANASYSYTGTVRTVGSGKTYATLTAAYTAAASGDIIEVYGTIDLTAESGGYWLINTAKSVLVRGSTSNAADTVLVKNSGTSFAIRVRVNTAIVFKDLTIQTNQNLPLIYNDADEANRNMICDNVRFIQNGTGTSAKWLEPSGVNTSQTRYFEFKNCYFERLSGTAIALNISLPSPNNTFLFTGCTFNNYSTALCRFSTTFSGTVIMYDNTFIQNFSDVCVQFGTDTSIPTSTIALVDFRGNVIKFPIGYCQHGLLLGRGTDDVKCYNNEVYMYSCNDAAAIGFVLKTTSTNVGDSLIKGNFAFAPRPFYIKGGSKMTLTNNLAVGNYADGNIWEALGFTNHKNGADEVLSRDNVITDNTFISKDHAIHVYNTGAAETDVVSFKTCTVDRNKYGVVADKFLYDVASTTDYTFGNRTVFWANQNDLNSVKINSFSSPNFL